MMFKSSPLCCKIYSGNIRFWIMFVYYPHCAALMPAILRPQGRRAIRLALLSLADRLASTLVLVAADLHFAVAGTFDDVSFKLFDRQNAEGTKPWMAKVAGALER